MSSYSLRQLRLIQLMSAWLILCIGVIGPFIYISTASPHHGLPAHHVSMFGETPPSLPTELVNKLAGRSLARSIKPGLAYQRLVPGTVCLFQVDLHQGDLLAGVTRQANHQPALISRLACFTLNNQSISLPPLDKPPPTYL